MHPVFSFPLLIPLHILLNENGGSAQEHIAVFLFIIAVAKTICYDPRGTALDSKERLVCNAVQGTVSMYRALDQILALGERADDDRVRDTCLPNGLRQTIFYQAEATSGDLTYEPWREACSIQDREGYSENV